MVLDDEFVEVKKVLVVGAGDGGGVVRNIIGMMRDSDGWLGEYSVIGFADDNVSKKDVICPISDIYGFKNTFFIVSISSNQRVRKKVFDKLDKDYVINAVHPSAIIDKSVVLGKGNIIGAGVHIGLNTVVGDNNLISSNCSIEHDNVIGSHNVFGPGVVTSGRTVVGDMCLFGANSSVMPHVCIGDNVSVASGISIWSNVSSGCRVVYESSRLPWRLIRNG